jgi:hypothetical protein
MPLLFRPRASAREKLYTLAMLAMWLLLINGLLSQFTPHAWLTAYAPSLGLPLALAFGWPLFRDTQIRQKLAAAGRFKRMLAYPLIAVVVWGLMWLTVERGVPATYTQWAGSVSAEHGLVSWKSDGRSARYRCAYAVLLQARAPSTMQPRLCLSAAAWQRTQVGDTIAVEVKTTWFGQARTALEASPVHKPANRTVPSVVQPQLSVSVTGTSLPDGTRRP